MRLKLSLLVVFLLLGCSSSAPQKIVFIPAGDPSLDHQAMEDRLSRQGVPVNSESESLAIKKAQDQKDRNPASKK